ncbi:heavy-metal-associated domain-containing protein [Mariniflexile fucanivorans]|uniref:Heavy-metal-associated domain-containing protein n=2 Tax=Mariniflexile fucanivorans TaxID=264023 RepID=A0A4R1RS37_9FLAO|nr:heavy-metal-associated domain-containing protein [Mariniflexile fucanivorans]
MMVAAIALFAMSCKNETKPEVKTVEVATETSKTMNPNATYAKAEFTIEGMTCAMGCAKTIEKKIAKMDGVKSASVDFDKKLAMVEYDEAKVNPALLEQTVTKVSDTYKVTNMKAGSSSKTSCMEACDKTGCEGKTDAEKAACQEACSAKTASTVTKKTCCATKAKA